MNQLPTLIKREFWEHRNTFLVLPAAAAGFVLFMMVFIFVASATEAFDMTIDLDSDEAHQWKEENVVTDDVVGYLLYRLDALHEADREEHINGWLHGLAVPFVGILWFVVFFYLLNTLYEDRRDRSILFWKSLPVSDALTVFSKLLTGLIIVPVVYLAFIVVLQLSSLAILSLGTIGTEVPVWATLWGPATLFGNWFNYIALLTFYSFWALPFFAWLLAVSAFAKSVPLVWAIGVPIALLFRWSGRLACQSRYRLPRRS
jgi:ABC-2 type transport system permease protein